MESFTAGIFLIWAAINALATQDKSSLDANVSVCMRAQFGLRSDCGVYSILAAAKVLKRSVAVDELLLQRYIPTFDGSSSSDLCRALTDLNLHHAQFRNLNLFSLEVAGLPAILEMKEPGLRKEFPGHWVTFLGFENNMVKIFDSAVLGNKILLVSPRQLLMSWTGNAIFVAKTNPAFLELKIRIATIDVLFPYLALLIGGFLLGVLGKNNSGFKARAFLLMALMLVGIGLNVITNFSSLPMTGQEAAWIRSRTIAVRMPTINEAELQRLSSLPETVFVDARDRSGFQTVKASVPTINVPVESGFDEFMCLQADISKSTTLVVFCANPQCDWDQIVATRFSLFGFKKVFVFEGGFQDFCRIAGTPK